MQYLDATLLADQYAAAVARAESAMERRPKVDAATLVEARATYERMRARIIAALVERQ